MAKHIIHVSEAEAAREFASLQARVREGAEVVIENDSCLVAVVRPAEPYVRLLSESLRLAREHGSRATLDGDFAKDKKDGIESHAQPLNPRGWTNPRLKCADRCGKAIACPELRGEVRVKRDCEIQSRR